MNFAESALLFKIKGATQSYAWGGYEYISQLIGVENDGPFAELWLGAHPQAPSTGLLENDRLPLDELIASAPELLLGSRANKTFGRLPFLLKVLDARDMLSIQVHPSKKQAEEGFARENAAGVPLDSPHRSYKDDNHKPEVHVALTDFWMLHGFRPTAEIAYVLADVPEFKPLSPVFSNGGLEGLYRFVMTMPQHRVDELLNPLLVRLQEQPPRDKNSPDHWALQAAAIYSLPQDHRDRGIFSIYFLNLLHLKSGEGTFQDAGVPHAYLSGVTVELMANSDNVLRGGLTPKRIDVEELLKTVVYVGGKPRVLAGRENDLERVFETTAPDFQLSEIRLHRGQLWESEESAGPSIFLMMEGEAKARSGSVVLACRRGEAFFAAAEAPITLSSATTARVFRATLPQ